MRWRGLSALGLCLLLACPASKAEQAGAPWRKPGDRIDSILPMPEYLRRFREGLAQPVEFRDGAASPERLARRFLSAVSARDTGAFSALMISRAEFAWLVFPHHLYAAPPYELDPEIFWMRLTAGSARGLGRTLERLGGRPLAFRALDCRRDTLQVREGPLRVWGWCGIRYREGDSLQTRRLFGSIVEREGRFKLLSYANDF
jgi:hypothetical protein